MTWLYSFIVASLVFSAEGNLPFQRSSDNSPANVRQIVKFDETERFEQVYPLDADGRVSVSNVNGSITIETWDSPQVKLEAVKTADSKDRLTELEIKIDSKQNHFQVEADFNKSRRNERNWNGRLQVEFKLTVPRNAVLDEIEAVNGSIYISNASNTTKASTVNGQIKATNLRGTANLSTVNGTVNADFGQLQTGSRISLDTVNGTVNLMMPSDANATVKADTVNGNINNEFGLPVRKGKYVGKDLYGKIGSGEVQIKLSSVNGGLFVKRQKDGKNVNPTINLLPAKNSGDDDWEGFENGANFSGVKPPNQPKSPANPMPPDFDGAKLDAETQREVLKALREAEKEMGKITPEMRKQIEENLKNTNIDTKEIQEQLKIAQEKYKETMVRMSNASWSPKIEKKSESFEIKGVPKVIIEANSSAVTVRGWDKDEVSYSVMKISNTSNQIPLNSKAEKNDQNIVIKVADNEDAMPFNGMNRIRIEVFVPKKSNLKIVTSGEIRLEGVSGEIDLNGADGAINVRDSDGKIHLTSTDGRVRVLGFKGELYAQTADGDVNLEGNFQKLTARTENGSIILTLPEDVDANLTTNKLITSEGLNLTKEKENNWRIGKGGADFQLQTTDGKLFIRNIAKIKAFQ